MIDWLTVVIALVIIATLVGFFVFLAWKIDMSDPLARDDKSQLMESTNDKKKKEKNTTEQGKKKRKEQKKPKRENKDEEQRNKRKESTVQTSEETDDEREESEQDLLTTLSQPTETSSKARKRNKNKPTTDEKTTKPLVTQPKHEQQTKVQVKSSQNKQTVPVPTTTTTKKSTESIQKDQEELPFTVVGGNKNKSGTPPAQQQNKSLSTASVPQPPTVPVQQQTKSLLTTSTPQPMTVPVQQHEPLTQRQKESTPIPVTHSLPAKQPTPKIADLIKVLPSSQAVVTELMNALDAFPLSTDELDIIMHKIANKQSVVKQDWTKLQHGKKVDPQAHIGQVMDESAKAYEDDLKNNSMKRIKELTDELNTEKRRNNELSKEKHDKEREIQILHAQLDSVHHKHDSTQGSTQKLQTLELQLRRITEENINLTQQLTQQQQHTGSNLVQTGDSSNAKVHVLNEQLKKLSIDNANLEKKVHSSELLAKEAQKEKEDITRYNEQLTQSLQKAEKELKHVEEKHHKQLDESRTTHTNEINEYKHRIEKLEVENEQLRREEIVHVEPTTATDIQTISVNTEEREQFEKEIQDLKQQLESKEKLNGDIEEYKKKLDELETQLRSKENELKQEIERIKQEKNIEQQQADESRNTELNTLRNELKSTISQSEDRLRQEREKHRHALIDLLSPDLRNQLPHDNQDLDQWLSSYRQLFEANKRTLQDECTELKHENEKLHKNMTDVENHLKEIEMAVQSKEEVLLTELKNKDTIVESIRGENEQLNGELQRLRNENQRLQSIHDASINETRALKQQLDEKFLASANTPSVVTPSSASNASGSTVSALLLQINNRDLPQ